ncbi:MAG TPA: hypothetical protein VL084_01815 [Thermoanaerobaculia bacterium]|nr:hypothetical protein [Thermoanaerobaculia bacterium]
MLVFPQILLSVILVSCPTPSPAQQGGAPAGRPVTCTFSNPSYSGYCKASASAAKEQSAADACQEILDCLNNVQCSKTYCNATQIRGGWNLVSAEEGPGN